MNNRNNVETMRKLAIPTAIAFAIIDIPATVLQYFETTTTIIIQGILAIVAAVFLIVLRVFAYNISFGTTATRAFRFLIYAYIAELVIQILYFVMTFINIQFIYYVIEAISIVEIVFVCIGFSSLYRSMRYDPNFYRDNYLRVFIWTTIIVYVLEVSLTVMVEFVDILSDANYISGLGSADPIIIYVITAISGIGNLVAQFTLALYVRNYRLDSSIKIRFVERNNFNNNGGYQGGYQNNGYNNRGREENDPFSDLSRRGNQGNGSNNPDISGGNSDNNDDDLFN